MNTPHPNDIYRHFKGNTYRVLALAQDAETGDRVVVYQALYGDNNIYTRTLAGFTERLDEHKYPYANQIHRFELLENPVSGSFKAEECREIQEQPRRTVQADHSEQPRRPAQGPPSEQSHQPTKVDRSEKPRHSDEGYRKEPPRRPAQEIPSGPQNGPYPAANHQIPKKQVKQPVRDIPIQQVQSPGEEPDLDPLLLEFLDNPGHQERLDILQRMRPRLTEGMINIMAIALETELQTPPGNLDAAYSELRGYLLTMDKYERKHR